MSLLDPRTSTMYHEMGHLLDDIARPGLLAAEKSLTYGQIVAAERTASIVEHGVVPSLWTTTNIHAAAIEAKTSLVSVAALTGLSTAMRVVEYSVRGDWKP